MNLNQNYKALDVKEHTAADVFARRECFYFQGYVSAKLLRSIENHLKLYFEKYPGIC